MIVRWFPLYNEHLKIFPLGVSLKLNSSTAVWLQEAKRQHARLINKPGFPRESAYGSNPLKLKANITYSTILHIKFKLHSRI